jgi:hypothetical protein
MTVLNIEHRSKSRINHTETDIVLGKVHNSDGYISANQFARSHTNDHTGGDCVSPATRNHDEALIPHYVCHTSHRSNLNWVLKLHSVFVASLRKQRFWQQYQKLSWQRRKSKCVRRWRTSKTVTNVWNYDRFHLVAMQVAYFGLMQDLVLIF